MENTLKDRTRSLYFGAGERSRRFRFALLTFDVVTISFFLVTSMLPDAFWIFAADFVIGVLLTIDYALRFWVDDNKWRYVFRPTNLADLVVILTMLAATFVQNYSFLRIMRALRLLRSYHVLRDFRENFEFFRRNEQIVQSVLNLVVFIFVITALVYVMQVRTNPQINTYIDALYFTITTLTTTGFGDITLEGSSGKLLAVVIMVFGISLFLRLVQTIFKPAKVRYTCPDCGLSRHDADAIHCKHCGRVLNIETEGM